VAHGGVERGREAECDAGFLHDLRHTRGREVEADAERFEDVGAARLRGRRPVAVLDDLGARARSDDGRHRRDVDAHRPVAARPDDVEEPTGYIDRGTRGVHRLSQPRDLLDGLTLGLETDREPGDLRGTRLTGEDLAHRPAGLLAREVLARDQGREHLGPGGHG
jgi:hypothetical protein